eukprot:238134-Alexandrium_andersonii.AAC.1
MTEQARMRLRAAAEVAPGEAPTPRPSSPSSPPSKLRAARAVLPPSLFGVGGFTTATEAAARFFPAPRGT